MTNATQPSATRSRDVLRRRTLHSAIGLCAVALPIISCLIAIQAYMNADLGWATILPCLYALLFPLLWLVRSRFSDAWGGAVFLALMLILAFVVQLRGGLTIAPATLQIVLLILAGLLFGSRGVYLTLTINLFSYALAGYAVLNGLTPPISDFLWDPAYVGVWVRGGLILTVFGGATAIIVTRTVARLQRESMNFQISLEREKRQRAALEVAEKEREAARSALAESQRVEALGRLASGIAHDFNNTLTVISGTTEFAAMDPTLPESVRASLDTIRKATDQAAHMTQSLLALTRKDPARLVPVGTVDLIQGMAQPLSRLLPDDIKLSIVTAADARILIDKSQAERALINIVLNARDAISGSGDIVVGCDRRNVEEDAYGLSAGEYAVIWVKDSGRGMTPDVQENLFKPFYTTNSAAGGTGMGMALIQGFVEESGGAIDIDSSAGGGTTVSLFFSPTQQQIQTEDPQVNLRQPDLVCANYTVFIVEDNDAVLQSSVNILQRAGFKLLQARDGDAALAKLRDPDIAFDILCIDGVIPGASSAQVIAQVQELRPQTPIIVCSGYIEEDLVLRGIRTGELAYLRKPFRPGELVATIESELANRARSRTTAS